MRRITVPAANPAQARQVIGSALNGASAQVVETAQLLVSELASNAIVHGSGCAALVVEVDAHSLHVEVLDSDPTVDLEPLQVEKSRPYGRGLAIVDALASSWGVETRLAVKAVWFNLDL